jgi:hypothetical protein
MMTDAMMTSRRYVIELEPGVWYCGGAIGDPPRTCDVSYASKHEYESAIRCLAHARTYRTFAGARLVPVESTEPA